MSVIPACIKPESILLLWIHRLAPVRLALPDWPDDWPIETFGNDKLCYCTLSSEITHI